MRALEAILVWALLLPGPGWAHAANGGEAENRQLPDGNAGAVAKPASQTSPGRDPFRPFILDLHPEGQTKQLTPLQRFQVGQLTVSATVWEANPPRALLEDAAGMGYVVTLGTAIGRNGGVITAIEPERVVVEERVVDFYGKEQVNRVVMETPKEEGPSQPARERK